MGATEVTLNDFLGRINANRRAHYVREYVAYYHATPKQAIDSYALNEVLVMVPHSENLRAVVTSKSVPQYEDQPRMENGYFRGVTLFYANPHTGAVYRDSNGKLLRRGSVNDTSYWLCNFEPHKTLDQWSAPAAYSLCVFRKNERLNRISRLKNYEL